MVGSWPVEVRAVQPFTIHGDLYFELDVARTDEPAVTPDGRVRVWTFRGPAHAAPDGAPRVGDRLVLTFLMGQVTSAKKG
jgi:hypothetical protein